MHIESLKIRNFRRLRDVTISLARDISIFVGANNSGKTSASQVLQLFMDASRERFTVHDFSAECWTAMDAFGESQEGVVLPTISLDIWFHVEETDLHRVIDLLPSLMWQGTLVGLRVEFAASDAAALLSNFHEVRDRVRASIRPSGEGARDYHPLPRTLREYLDDNLRREFELRYYVLDRAQFDASLVEQTGYSPSLITLDKGRSGKDILASLLRVDFLHAQRHLSDNTGSRAEDLSRCLSRFYDRNLQKRENDYDALRALAESEAMLNEHLQRVFGPTLSRLAALGYPGISNPRLLIKSALNPAAIMSSQGGARVHYALGNPPDGGEPPTLPDRYTGLGFKNLIYMVVELLDLHAQWMDIEENRPPLHLIFIEEPEAHLHAQLQQVFIRKVIDILMIEGDDRSHYASQLVITTHSPHILYERGFRPIRYFRRVSSLAGQTSQVLNLSAFYDCTANPTRDFLERYLKLTHCDLFFADAAVLVEGNVERLLLPQMIKKAAPMLQSAYLSILEIGGAFGYRFRPLIEFLGITALIITDIDSVTEVESVAEGGGDQMTESVDTAGGADEEAVAGTTCMVQEVGAVTSNQTLIQWLPAVRTIADLLGCTPAQRTQMRSHAGDALIRVTYQTTIEAMWGGRTAALTGRTLEEAFALENLVRCQDAECAELKLRIRGSAGLTLEQLVHRLHKRIKASGFNKTDFALALLAQDPMTWRVPSYIADGLRWLEVEITPSVAPNPQSESADTGTVA